MDSILPIQKKQMSCIDHPLVPVHLLVWAVHSFVTTMTCLVDVWSWTDRTSEQKTAITGLYGPYVLFGTCATKKE